MSELSREPSGAECIVPPAAILAFAYVFLFLLLILLDLFFMPFDVLGVLPQTKGPSALTMMKLTNALFIAYMALRVASSGSVPRARRRTHRASCLAGAGLLLLMQLYLSTLGNLHWQGYHSYHAENRDLPLPKRIEHYTSAIRHCPGVISEDEHLGRAHAYRLIGEHERAVEDYDAYIRLRTSEPYSWDPKPSAYCGRAISLRELGRHERAREDFDSAMKLLEIGGKRIEDFGRRGPDIIAALLSRPGKGRKTLVELGDPEIVTRLIPLLETAHLRDAAYALGEIGDARAVPALIEVVRARLGRDEWASLDAITALGKIGDRRAVGTLARALLRARHPYVRRRAILALARIGDAAAAPALLAVLDTDKEDDVRAAAVCAICELSGVTVATRYYSGGEEIVNWEKRQGVGIVVKDSYGTRGVNERHARAWARRFMKEHPEAVAECERMMDKPVDEGAAGSAGAGSREGREADDEGR